MTLIEFAVGLAVAFAVAAMRAVALWMRQQRRDLARVEAKLDAVMKHVGVRFDPYAGLPTAVADALRRGRKIEAIKEYRLATGANLEEAKDYVEEIERRVVTVPPSRSLH